MTYDAADPSGLPEDPDWHGFQRIGSVLTFSPAHIEKYMLAAEMALGRGAFAWAAAQARDHALVAVRDAGMEKLRKRVYRPRHRGQSAGRSGAEQRALDVHDIVVKTAGEYIVRVKLSGLARPSGRAPRLRLYAGDISRVLYEADVEAPEEKPVTIEFRTHLPAGTHPIRIVNAVPGPNPKARRSRPGPSATAFTSIEAPRALADEVYR